MQPFTQAVGFWLGSSFAYLIPRYQRHYSWDDARWHDLVQDVLKAATAPDTSTQHWLGVMLVTSESATPNPTRYGVIDGQQRLVTLRVWLAALHDFAREGGILLPNAQTDFAEMTVQDADAPAFTAAISSAWREQRFSEPEFQTGPLAAYRYFRWLLWLGSEAILSEDPVKMPRPRRGKHYARIEDFWSEWLAGHPTTPQGGEVDILGMWNATQNKLTLHALIHEPHRGDEAPEEIFESLNGQRTPLEPLDHVRNSVFIRLSGNEADDLYETRWKPIEKRLMQTRTKRTLSATLFLYDFVISQGEFKRQGSIATKRGAAHFARMTRGMTSSALTRYVDDTFLAAMAAWPVALGRRSEADFAGHTTRLTPRTESLLKSIAHLSQNPATPLALRFLTARLQQRVSDSQLEELLFLVENYLARYFLSGLPMSPLRSQIMKLIGDIEEDTPSGLQEALRGNRWLTDEEVLASSSTRPFYGPGFRPEQVMTIFRGIERKLSGGSASHPLPFGRTDEDFTVEHIYPQDAKRWPVDLEAWGVSAGDMQTRLHALGNLTPVTVRYNKQATNKPFADKKALAQRPEVQPSLILNQDWIRENRWTSQEIDQRTRLLVEKALSYWDRPEILPLP